ncbi:hypothetical protein ACNFG0_01440 [Pseudomonas sp. NY15372]|uniref:hypothetical protein n=1 Tax=Pseudomonas sp. NY15372 TaxID=3400356 RepID=UPI003A8C6A49
MKAMWRFGPCLFLALTGCSITNQGAVDYRYSRPGTEAATLSSKYVSAAKAKNALKTGDPVTITLKQVYINQLTEFKTPLRYVRFEPTTGDVAIIASACESPCKRNFGPEGLRNSKVIFYSNDVRERQFLNLSNLQGIYGPISYTGKPLKIDLYMIELDESGEQIKQLLSNLATLGQTFYPPAHPAATVLTTLADTFIRDDQDDNIFTYSFDLIAHRSDDGILNPNTAYLETGNYILVRSENRERAVPWDNLGFNTPTGRLVYRKDNCVNASEPNPSCYFTDSSYAVLEINKAASAIANTNDEQQVLYSTLRQQIEQASASAPLSTEKIDALKEELTSIDIRNQSVSALSRIEGSQPDSAQRRAATLSFVTLWSDTDKVVAAKDADMVATRFNSILVGCTGISEQQMIAYHDEVKHRAITDKASLLNTLNTCTLR